MWTVAIYAIVGGLTIVTVGLLIRLRDEIHERVWIEENVEYTRDLQIRAINQLRQEVADLQKRILELQRQKSPLPVSAILEQEQEPMFPPPSGDVKCSISSIKGEATPIAQTLPFPFNDEKNILHKGVSSLKYEKEHPMVVWEAGQLASMLPCSKLSLCPF